MIHVPLEFIDKENNQLFMTYLKENIIITDHFPSTAEERKKFIGVVAKACEDDVIVVQVYGEHCNQNLRFVLLKD